MGEVFEGVDRQGQRYEVRKKGGGGLGCLIVPIIIGGLVIALLVWGVYSSWWLWNAIPNYFTYHILDADRKHAAQFAAEAAAGANKDKDVETVGWGVILRGNYTLSDGKLDSALGGYPGQVVTLNDGGSAGFPINGGGNIPQTCKTSGCQLTVYVQRSSSAVTMEIEVSLYSGSSYTKEYTLSIPAGSTSGTVFIEGCGGNCSDNDAYIFTIYGNSGGVPLEAIVVEKTGQQSTSTSAHPTPQPTLKPTVRVNVPSRFAGTYYQVQDGSSYDVRLEITKQNGDGTFSGKWFVTVNGSEEDVIVTGVIAPYRKRYQFSQLDPTKLVVTNPDNNFIWFKSTSRDVGQDILMGYEYYGTLSENLNTGDQNGHINGVSYPPGGGKGAGQFNLDAS